MIKKKTIPKRKEDAILEKILDDEIIIYDKTTHTIHNFNKTAGILWNLCDGKMPVNEIINYLTEHFKGDKEIITKDVCTALEEMKEKKLLTFLEKK